MCGSEGCQDECSRELRTVLGAFGAVIVVTLPGMLVHWLLRVVVNVSRTLKNDIILKHKLHSFIAGRSDSYHLPQLQFAREHTCFSGFGSGFVVLPMIFTAPLDLTAAFGCGITNKMFVSLLCAP